MARYTTILVAVFGVLVAVVDSGDNSIGVNWGIIASQPLDPPIVVNMLKDNGIKKVKLFDSDSSTVNSLAKTGIQVIVALPNDQLHRVQDSDSAADWVKENVTGPVNDGVDIRYVAVGNEPFLKSYNNSFTNLVLPAMKNIQKALEKAGYGGKIKTTVPLNSDVYEGHSEKPSAGDFRKDIKSLMVQIVKFLHSKNSVFMVNIYPYISLYQNKNFPKGYAFFDGGGRTINDNGKSYTNVFDANYDTLLWALKKNGVAGLKVVVGEVGWPTDGESNANVENARRFYEGLMKKLREKEGTPLRPGAMEVYLFGLLDEDMKSVAPGPFERHWGIFTYDGRPKFQFDISGKGNNKVVGAKGVQYLDPQWCVLDWEETDLSQLTGAMGWVCDRADCTPLLKGGSCSGLGKKNKASYAFNMFFQMNGQDMGDCDFNGLGRLTDKNASTKDCVFPIQIDNGSHKTRTGLVFVVMLVLVSLVML